MPGGVSSPVRAFGAVGGTPLVIARARGATLVDVDGREYVDFVGSWGPLILGHAHPSVVEAVEAAARTERPSARLRVRDRARRGRGRALSRHRAGALRLLGHRGRDERRTPRARRDRPRARRQVRGLLPRPRRRAAGRRRLGPRDVRPALVAGVPTAFAALTASLPLDDEAAVEALFAAHGRRDRGRRDRAGARERRPAAAAARVPARLRALRRRTARC